MKIGLIDADLMWRKKTNRYHGKGAADVYPNLAIMKLSAWHKAQGDDVGWYVGLEHYDRVYISKVFSDTPESGEVIYINPAHVVCVMSSSPYDRPGVVGTVKLVDMRSVTLDATPDEVARALNAAKP